MTADRYELPRWESTELLRTEPVGRICIIAGGHPLAVPVNYRLDEAGDSAKIVIRTAPGTLLGRYEGLSSLEVDHIDLAAGTAWSVIVRGTIHPTYEADRLSDPHPLLEGRHQWMVLEPTAITGRRFVVARSADGYSVDWQLAGP